MVFVFKSFNKFFLVGVSSILTIEAEGETPTDLRLHGLPALVPFISLLTLLFGEILIGVRTFLSEVKWKVSACPRLTLFCWDR